MLATAANIVMGETTIGTCSIQHGGNPKKPKAEAQYSNISILFTKDNAEKFANLSGLPTTPLTNIQLNALVESICGVTHGGGDKGEGKGVMKANEFNIKT